MGRGRAIVQAVSRRFLTSEGGVWYQGSPCELCDGQGARRVHICQRLRPFLVNCHSTEARQMESGRIGDGNSTEHKHTPQKEKKVEGLQRKREDRQKRMASQTLLHCVTFSV